MSPPPGSPPAPSNGGRRAHGWPESRLGSAWQPGEDREGPPGRRAFRASLRPRSGGCERGELAERREPAQCLSLELAHALAGEIELVPDGLERPRLALEPEAELEDAPLALRQGVER